MRSAIGATTIALAALLFGAAPAGAEVTVAILPAGTTVRQVAATGLSPGLMSAGLGAVPAQQTYLDIGQGNRVFDSLYDTDLPIPKKGDCPAWWSAVTRRAESAPAEIVPGLLTRTLEAAGGDVVARGEASCAFLAGRPPDGRRSISKKSSGTPRHHVPSPTVEVREASVRQLSLLARSQRADDLLIAVSRPTGASAPLPIGLAGRGFGGDLTSDSTRTDGYVLSTDLAPTILARLGIEIPTQMSGQEIRTEGDVDPGAIGDLGDRLEVVSQRRGPVIGFSLLAWMLVLGLAAALTRGAAARSGVRVVGLAVVYMPAVLLALAAAAPAQTAEALTTMLGAPVLAGLTLALFPGYRALAVAAATTVLAYALDVVAGSPLTALSLLGPNPGLGVRFYGIGNELEALLTVLVVAGAGAALTGFAPALSRRGCAVAFLATGLLAAFVFAAGRFGADVGAAIVLPVGAAVAAALVTGRRRRAVWLVVALPLAVLALLALIDLVSGANAHLTRSVLDAGGLGDLSDVAQRRLQLSAHSFARPIVFVFLPLIAALAALAVVRRERLLAWFEGRPALRAGLAGALVATLVGTLANDSGALVLEIGAAYLLVFAGFAWAEAGR